jgi:hypothetical protein
MLVRYLNAGALVLIGVNPKTVRREGHLIVSRSVWESRRSLGSAADRHQRIAVVLERKDIE